ncbi:DUF2189 domain-containing protein [Plastoroseomonas arctica]|uniref:DUF2189 domain-containing protein n=1 Tax=Plastoroseomonas arctica TaxID=1509237 RepID=A0AAF1JYH4_9PROT|nr:DUF2189 domain-containing protein [Plastoroseomonas arctica]MBR0655975.1 DUF2189 domain-containing protein [Plastoroseomonas arctica]
MVDGIAVAQGATVAEPAVRKIGINDLFDALGKGWRDFQAAPTQLIFLAVIYPVIGALAARAAWGGDLMTLFFPLVSGFALMGPILALGVYELSRRREQGKEVSAFDALAVRHSAALPSILVLGLVLVVLFIAWVVAARVILHATLGSGAFAHPMDFLARVFGTSEGWELIIIGHTVGAIFATIVLAVTVVSFPLLLDRNPGLGVAVRTSLRAVAANPVTMAIWGVIIAALLIAGSATLFVGLAVAMPVLGHATWHLYRHVVV